MDPSIRHTRIPALDGIRGLAVLIVVVHNAAWIGHREDNLIEKLFSAAAAAGWVGVQLFFVLSGFLITGILLDEPRDHGFFRRFFVRRTLRIVPLYYATLATVALLAWWQGPGDPWATVVYREQWAYWLYISNWTEPFTRGIVLLNHVWSLAVEEQFYLVWPFLVWHLRAAGVKRLTLALVLLGPAIRFGMHWAGLPALSLYTFTIARMDALAVGALLAIVMREPNGRDVVRRLFTPVTAVVVASLTVLTAVQHGFHGEELPIQVAGQSLIALLAACLIAWGVGVAPIEAAFIKRHVVQGALPDLGKYSYAIYILHAPVHRKLQPLLEGWVNGGSTLPYLIRLLAYIALLLAISYALARVTWVVLERPFLSLKERWSLSVSPRTA